jgi:hypothetical protein
MMNDVAKKFVRYEVDFVLEDLECFKIGPRETHCIEFLNVNFVHQDADILNMIRLDGTLQTLQVKVFGNAFEYICKMILGGTVVRIPLVMTSSNRCALQVPPHTRKALGQLRGSPFAKDNPENFGLHDKIWLFYCT